MNRHMRFSVIDVYKRQAIELRILSCIVNGLWYDLHAANEFCSLGQEQGDSSDSAVQIPNSFISPPVLLYPVFGILIMGLLMTFAVEPVMGGINTALVLFQPDTHFLLCDQVL